MELLSLHFGEQERPSWSTLAIASRLSRPASTVRAVLVRCRLNQLSHIGIRTGERNRRYEHDHPGSLIYVDIKKLGNIPVGAGGGSSDVPQGAKNRVATSGIRRSPRGDELLGHAFVHTVVDDHSRVAYAEVHDGETADTALPLLCYARAASFFRTRGAIVERVISDDGSCYRSKAWLHPCSELGVKPKRTRPYRPQTNGKAERFHRTMAAEWAFSHHYHSETQRRSALAPWLHTCITIGNTQRSGRYRPFTRLTNLPGQYSQRSARPRSGRYAGDDLAGIGPLICGEIGVLVHLESRWPIAGLRTECCVDDRA